MMWPFGRRFLVLYVPVWWWSFLLVVNSQEVAVFAVRYQVLEEVPVATVLGKLSEELGRTEATGTFQLLQSSAVLPIQVDSQDGLLSTVGRLDREQLCPQREPCVISFSVVAAKFLVLINVEILILDINDNGPQFPKMVLELDISTSTLLQTRIPLDHALDADAGSNSLCSYRLSPSEHFALEVSAGAEGTQWAELVVIKEVNRELYSSFELTLTAFDHGEPPRSGTALVRVTVLDSSDDNLMFAQTFVTVEIKEDALPGTLLTNLTAIDPDQESNRKIEYSFSKHTSAEVLRTFTIETQTGHVFLQQSLDYEKNRTYELVVQATYYGANTVPAHCKLLVCVLDVNDNTPDIHVVWARHAAVLSEAQPKGSFVALVTASDPDSGNNGEVNCYIGQGSEHFTMRRINLDSYMLLTSAPLDRESWAEHNLTLLVQDRGTPLLTAIRYFTIHVSDVNDNSPCFEAKSYNISIAENSVPPSALLVVRAHDADTGLNGKIVYRILDPVISKWFTIDPRTGEIWAHAALDAENITSIDFLVLAEDAGQPGLSASVSVRVTVLDMNDNSPVVITPELEGGCASITVLVDIDTGYVLIHREAGGSDLFHSVSAPLLFTMSATDADSGLNGALRYSILHGNETGMWLLDPQSGQFYLRNNNASSLVGSEWNLELSVSDQGVVPRCTRVPVKVTFDGYYEHMPNSFPLFQPLSHSAVMGICLVGLLTISLVSLGLVMSLCKREKHGHMAYNCREAEHAYSQQQPKKPLKLIQKADIHVVPVLRRGDVEQPQAKIENPPETIWVDALGMQCHMTPTLYRTLRNQRNLSTLAEQNEGFASPAVQHRPFCAQKFRYATAQDAQSTASKSCAKDPLSEMAPQNNDMPNLKAGLEAACSHQRILRSLVRLSLAALTEQGPAKQLTMDSAPVQISQLLSLLHQGQVQPKPNHRGNKYTAKHGFCRSPSQDGEDFITKEGGDNEHCNLELLGEKLENLLDSPSGLELDQLTEADPTWMARLSLPLSVDYRDNVVSPDAVQSLPTKEAKGSDEPHTFATFGKTARDELNTTEPMLASTFFSEMSTLFDIILAQKASSHMDSSLGLLRHLSICSRTLELGGDATGAVNNNYLGSRTGNYSSKDI
ncbi:protocadherin-12 isoform X2 [Tiliqua scincoides]|uniref:protocadherin-12 isoform X2 n=1 Tax=Tiliqua scincoides TaxID=71010 RepID=UPI0034628D24